MRLLVTMQALDLDDPVLSAYHSWALALAARVERLEIIVLKEGRHALPLNVRVHTLGKERGRVPPFLYAFRFITLAWSLDREYDAVFVHMNQEYILIAGWLWKLLGKKIYLWRNHYAGSFLTDIAAAFCDKVFCTSKYSYTAKLKNIVFMPVGVDIERFQPDGSISRLPRSILFFARISPSKRLGLLVDALIILSKRGVQFTASIVGSPLPKHEQYLAAQRQRITDAGLTDRVTFSPGVSNENAVDIFRAHELFVNTSPSGMLDKMIFEAANTGCVVIAESKDFKDMAGAEFVPISETSDALANTVQGFLLTPSERISEYRKRMKDVAASQGLSQLMDRLVGEIA